MPSNSTPTKLSLAHVVFFGDNVLSGKKMNKRIHETKITKLRYMKNRKQNKSVELISINSKMRDFCLSELS